MLQALEPYIVTTRPLDRAAISRASMPWPAGCAIENANADWAWLVAHAGRVDLTPSASTLTVPSPFIAKRLMRTFSADDASALVGRLAAPTTDRHARRNAVLSLCTFYLSSAWLLTGLLVNQLAESYKSSRERRAGEVYPSAEGRRVRQSSPMLVDRLWSSSPLKQSRSRRVKAMAASVSRSRLLMTLTPPAGSPGTGRRALSNQRTGLLESRTWLMFFVA